MKMVGNAMMFCFAAWLALHAVCGEVDGCNNGGCVALASPPIETEQEKIHEIQCTLSCIQENGISLEVISDYAAWPTLRISGLENNCKDYQKVQECKTGCIAGFRNPTRTINRCRDECYADCYDVTCRGASSCEQPESSCERSCRKTYCRFGCQLHNLLTSGSEANGQSLQSPMSSPVLTPVQDSTNLFHVDATQAVPQNNSSIQPPVVGYLFRVELVSSTQVSYYWQHNLETPLDLSALACSEVLVSFAVVSSHNISEYSPRTQVCIGGVSGRPAQVDSNAITVHYTEHTEFLGYAVANITWEKPQGHQYISSYKITITSETAECGGVDTVHTYTDINSNASSFIVYAYSSNGFMKFGCSYILTILALPAESGQVGTHKAIAPALSDPTPQLEMACSKIWDHDGFFNISVTWTIPSLPALRDAIKRFTVNAMLQDSKRFGALAILALYDAQNVMPQGGQFQYNITLTNFLPQQEQHYRYKVELRTERKEEYFWRRVPSPKSCRVDSSSQPPVPITDIRVNDLAFDEDQLQLNLQWSPPSIINGELSEYEAFIGPDTITEDLQEERNDSFMQKIPATNTSAFINATIELNESIHCLYLQMRSYNRFLHSEWSKPVILARDSECSNSQRPPPNASNQTENSSGSLSVYYENDNGIVKILEVDCHDAPDSTSESMTARLQRIEVKLDAITEDQAENHATLLTVEERITSIEQKLDAITTLLSSHVST